MTLSAEQEKMLEQEKQARAAAALPKQKAVLDLWRGAADSVLSALFTGKEAMLALQKEGVTTVHLPAGRWQRIHAILLREISHLKDGDIINAQVVLDHWIGNAKSWTPDEERWFNKMVQVWQDGNAKFHRDAIAKGIPLLKKYSAHYRIEIEIASALEDMRGGHSNVSEVLAHLPDALQRIHQSSIRVEAPQVTAKHLANSWDNLETSTNQIILSPNRDINRLTGGIQRGGITLVAGEQKSGKTRFAYSHVLYALQQGLTVAVFSLEELKPIVMRRLGIMLSYQYIAEKWGDGLQTTTTDQWGHRLEDIDILWYLTEEGHKKLNHPKRKEARLWAKSVIESYDSRLRVYDETDGTLLFENLMGWVKADAAAYSVPDITMIDHTHHMIVPTNSKNDTNADYVRLSHIAAPLHQHALGSNTAMLLLTQRNGESNRSLQTKAGNMLGVRGGEVLTEKALQGFVIRGQIDNDGQVDVDHQYVYIKAQRFGTPIPDALALPMHPSTGWLLPEEIHVKKEYAE